MYISMKRNPVKQAYIPILIIILTLIMIIVGGHIIAISQEKRGLLEMRVCAVSYGDEKYAYINYSNNHTIIKYNLNIKSGGNLCGEYIPVPFARSKIPTLINYYINNIPSKIDLRIDFKMKLMTDLLQSTIVAGQEGLKIRSVLIVPKKRASIQIVMIDDLNNK